MMKTPLADAIKNHLDHISFHTPAHSGVISPYDITELSYSGNLLSDQGIIKESQEFVSKAYGADKTFFVTSGATTALHTAMAVFKGSTFLVFGNAHKSVFSGLRLFASEAYYLNDIDNLECALQEIMPAALIVTSPDYFGNTLRLNHIQEWCVQNNVALIIDAAHGSHFVFCDNLPVSATKYGDLVIHSLHKTLPVLTGGAVLHCKSAYSQRAAYALGELHTSSPSYPVMLSIESAVATMVNEGQKLWQNTLDKVAKFTIDLPAPYKAVKNNDPTRLVITSPYEGAAVAGELEKLGIFAEMSYGDKVVFIVNPYNADKLTVLNSALSTINGLAEYKEQISSPCYSRPQKLTVSAKYCIVPIKEAVGKTLYREIGYYPPGVPLYLPGHTLTKQDTEFLSSSYKTLFGLDNEGVFVVL